MVYCSNCGAQLQEEAYFCPKCGVKTMKGIEAGISTPMEDLREAFAKVGLELEKAFSSAAKDVQRAFDIARKNVQESTRRKAIVCAHCGEKNSPGSSFCFSCGKKLD